MTDQPTNEDLAMLEDLLADPATWIEPRGGLEDDVVRAVAESEPEVRSGQRRARRILAAVAAVAAIAAVVVAVVGTTRNSADAFDAALAPTRLAPAAHASVGVKRNAAGFGVSLDASGLPPLAPGEYYQAWLKNADGTSVPIGTFSSSNDRVELWSGVSPAQFPTMTITVEATDNDQTSSGRVVLAGPVRAH